MPMQADVLPWQGRPTIQIRDGSDLNLNLVQKEFISHRNLTDVEKATDSNKRELIAACHLLDSCASHCRGNVVLIYLDNMNAATICVKGSSKCCLQKYAEKISKLCLKFDIELRPVWIPRDLKFYGGFPLKML